MQEAKERGRDGRGRDKRTMPGTNQQHPCTPGRYNTENYLHFVILFHWVAKEA